MASFLLKKKKGLKVKLCAPPETGKLELGLWEDFVFVHGALIYTQEFIELILCAWPWAGAVDAAASQSCSEELAMYSVAWNPTHVSFPMERSSSVG